MSPDGESTSIVKHKNGVPIYDTVVHEFKATYKSTKTVGNLTGEWMWLSQMMAYCKALNTTYAMMHTLFINGDYQFPLSPLKKIWFLEFTKQEIDDNWKLLMQYKKHKGA
jgi:hypothetical protein